MTSPWSLTPPHPSTSTSSSFHDPSNRFDHLPYPSPPSMSPTSSLGVPTTTLSTSGHMRAGPPYELRRARSSDPFESESTRFAAASFTNPFQSTWSPPFLAASPPRREPYDWSQATLAPSRRPSSTSGYYAGLASGSSTSSRRDCSPPRIHRRTSSAQPAFYVTPSTTASPSSPRERFAPEPSAMSSRGAAMGWTLSAPTSQDMQAQPSREEVDQFLRDMSELLGPDAGNSFSQTSSPSYGFALQSTPPRPVPTKRATPTRTYNVSGVLLSEEDYLQFTSGGDDAPLDLRQYSISGPSQPGSNPRHASHYEPFRPRSAPPSPQVDDSTFGGASAFVPYYSPPPSAGSFGAFSSPSSTTPTWARRRGSSVDATVPRTFASTAPGPPSYGFASYPTPPRSHPPSCQPAGYPPPYIPPSVAVSGMPASPPPRSRTLATPSPPRKAKQAPRTPRTPTATRSTAAAGASSKDQKKKPPGAVVSFVNFSASDSSVLLSGVAPSGSSKKRPRPSCAVGGEGEGGASSSSSDPSRRSNKRR
ncbi:hypothetical protein JCM10212_003376 [Sporobolomyces blumeae]